MMQKSFLHLPSLQKVPLDGIQHLRRWMASISVATFDRNRHGKPRQPAYVTKQLHMRLRQRSSMASGQPRSRSSALSQASWPAPGSEDTELGVLMELEVAGSKTKAKVTKSPARAGK
jgi:hypothetical protein